MTDWNNRTVEAEIDCNADGTAYFSSAVYLDTGEVCSDEVLEYLSEQYEQELFEAEAAYAAFRRDEEYYRYEA